MKTRGLVSGFLAALAVLTCVVGARLDAAVPGPKWLAGFPLRAGNSVILMWSPIPGATGYRLFKKTDAAPFKEIYKGTANTYSETLVSHSETVIYKVAGILKDADSELSAPGTLKAVEQLQAPVFTGAIGLANLITLRWSSPSGTIYSNVYRADSEKGPYMLLESIQMDTYTDRTPERGKIYFYRIASVGNDGRESLHSLPTQASLREMSAAGEGGAEKTVIRKVAAKGFFRGEELYELNQPSYTGFTREGDLYVLERRGIQFFDHDGWYRNRITFNRSWGLPGGLIQDTDGTFLIPFYAEKVIRRINRTGKLEGELRYPPYVWGKAGPAKKSPEMADVESPEAAALRSFRFRNNPNQITIDGNGDYWIVDGVRAQAIKINGKGEELAVIGRPPGTYDERDMVESDLPTARGIQYNPIDGKLYVVLGVTAQIKVIDPRTATVVATFGGFGTGNAKFQGIGGLAFRKNGNILVLDHLMQAIKEFNPKYGYLATYVDVIERGAIKLSSNLLTNFAFDEEDRRFYISSAMGNRVYIFDILPQDPSPPPR